MYVLCLITADHELTIIIYLIVHVSQIAARTQLFCHVSTRVIEGWYMHVHACTCTSMWLQPQPAHVKVPMPVLVKCIHNIHT